MNLNGGGFGWGQPSFRGWVRGLFYVDRDDPSIMVEKRFGLGYTLNYGNHSVLIVATFLLLSLGLIALGLSAMWKGVPTV